MATKESKKLVELLAEVQSELKAPKGQRNSFGKYNYRSAEDIVEAVKPLLNSRGLILNLSDSMDVVGERYYIKATASVISGDGESVCSIGYAREALSQAGMSDGQVTGATSSYARKYALNGLFAIDDTKDLDSDEYQGKGRKETAPLPTVPKTNDKEVKLDWLNKNTEAYTKVEEALKAGKGTLDQVKTKYKLSNEVEKELTALIPK